MCVSHRCYSGPQAEAQCALTPTCKCFSHVYPAARMQQTSHCVTCSCIDCVYVALARTGYGKGRLAQASRDVWRLLCTSIFMLVDLLWRCCVHRYNCGKVCLSLLGTWQGGKGEGWIPGVSTANQVCAM